MEEVLTHIGGTLCTCPACLQQLTIELQVVRSQAEEAEVNQSDKFAIYYGQ